MDLVHEAYKEGGLLQQKLKGYQLRPQQKEFAQGIQQAIVDRHSFLGEAPTGVGKSLAALIPAVEVVINEDAKAVVVTSSIILQEQYIKKDIPTLIELLGTPISFSSIKGRNNYVCQIKAQEQSISGDLVHSNTDEYRMVLKFATTSKSGDFAEMGFVPSSSVHSMFAVTEEHECTGKLCPAYSTCHYYRERKKMLASQIIVCNYHYYFTAQKAKNMLPEHVRVVIFDEGHEMGDIALNFLEQKYSKFSWRNINTFLNKTAKALPKFKQDLPEKFKMMVNINEIIFSQESALDTLTQVFLKEQKEKEYWSLDQAQRRKLQDIVFTHYQILEHRLEALQNYIERYGLPPEEEPMWYELYSDEEIAWQHALQKLKDALKEKKEFIQDFFLIGDGQVKDTNEMIYWLQNDKVNGVSLHAKPPQPASFTKTLFQPEQTGCTPIVMSATLTARQSFDHVATELGVPSERKELIVSSPFDLSENLLWYLPESCPAGNDEGHHDFAVNEMKKIIQYLGGKTLCLFTSNQALRNAAQTLRKELPKSIKILSQLETTKRHMIESLRSDASHVLLGTRSFFTGVDIQGEHLSAVLIDKIPFPMIGDPICDYLMNQPNGFRKFTLPTAIVTMKQGIGRLNRTPTDRGVVAVFDGRLSTANYKNIIFSSFDFKITATRKDTMVKKYMEDDL